MDLALKARLRLCYGETFSRALARSLSPDDVPPKGFSLRGHVENECYVYEVLCAECLSEDILTLASILSEVILLSILVRKIIDASEANLAVV